MAVTARDLITNAYILSGIVAKDYETVSGSQIDDGLYLLNAFLAIKSADIRYIPYFEQYNFPAIVGEQKYHIDGLIQIETFTFFINEVRYQTNGVGRDRYFGWARANNIRSLPLEWHYERSLGGSDLYLYFLPDQTYPLEIWGKFNLSSVTLDQDLSLSLDAYYIEYLRYGLMAYLCSENSITIPVESAKILNNYEKYIQDISPPDLTTKTNLAFGSGINFTYADANIGKGYRP